MLCASINKQTIYYALCVGTIDSVDENGNYTGEVEKVYATPVNMRINVSPTNGRINHEMFGLLSDYTATMVTAEMSCPIATDTKLWVGITPENNNPHNYEVVGKHKSLNSITYAIKEVSASGT